MDTVVQKAMLRFEKNQWDMIENVWDPEDAEKSVWWDPCKDQRIQWFGVRRTKHRMMWSRTLQMHTHIDVGGAKWYRLPECLYELAMSEALRDEDYRAAALLKRLMTPRSPDPNWPMLAPDEDFATIKLDTL